jgi:hypothetical protein
MELKPAFLSLEINRFLRTYLPTMPPVARRERFRMLTVALINFRQRAESTRSASAGAKGYGQARPQRIGRKFHSA